MGILHHTFQKTSSNFYAADVYMGEFVPPTGKDVLFSMSSLWSLTPNPGDISIRVDIYHATTFVISRTFITAKSTAGTPSWQRFQPDAEIFLPAGSTAKFYLRSTNNDDDSMSHSAYLYLIDPCGSNDVYHADIDVAVDEENTKDEYTVTWFKNGVRVPSGSISTAKIQVVKRADGTNLIGETTPSPGMIGSTGSYGHDESTNRIEPGEAVLVIATATIDSIARSFSKLVSRDSAA